MADLEPQHYELSPLDLLCVDLYIGLSKSAKAFIETRTHRRESK